MGHLSEPMYLSPVQKSIAVALPVLVGTLGATTKDNGILSDQHGLGRHRAGIFTDVKLAASLRAHLSFA
jgi:hypothetical protein